MAHKLHNYARGLCEAYGFSYTTGLRETTELYNTAGFRADVTALLEKEPMMSSRDRFVRTAIPILDLRYQRKKEA